MPLLDHFQPPLFPRFHWESLHSAWANSMTQELNTLVLPAQYIAAPYVHLGAQVEVDVGTFEQTNGKTATGGIATAVYAPPRAPLTAALDFTDLDVFEVQIRPDDGTSRLAAAIEFISPANKDRPANRQAFAVKCASYLQSGASVILVDIVTKRSGNLHMELLRLLKIANDPVLQAPDDLYAVAYRTISRKNKIALESWPIRLRLGETLPTLPLWLASDFVVPLNLESSYLAACANLRISVM